MVIVNTRHRWTLIRLITMASVLVCSLGTPTLVGAQPPTPEERLASIEATLTQILERLGESNDYTHARLGDLRDSINTFRDDLGTRIDNSHDDLGARIDANHEEISELREEVSRLRTESTVHFVTIIAMLFLWPPIILGLVGLYAKRKG